MAEQRWWHGLSEEQLAKRCDELVAEKDSAVLEEARWWHQRLHRALGIPCDMETLEECSRMDMLEGIADKTEDDDVLEAERQGKGDK